MRRRPYEMIVLEGFHGGDGGGGRASWRALTTAHVETDEMAGDALLLRGTPDVAHRHAATELDHEPSQHGAHAHQLRFHRFLVQSLATLTAPKCCGTGDEAEARAASTREVGALPNGFTP